MVDIIIGQYDVTVNLTALDPCVLLAHVVRLTFHVVSGVREQVGSEVGNQDQVQNC